MSTVPGELDRARQLIFAADEVAAKDLLIVLGEQIEDGERDDLLLEIFALLGEIYLVRTAYNGTEECIRRIDDCLTIYRSIRAGTNPEAAAQVTMSDAEIDHMLLRYTRRAQFLRTGLAAAAHGDHEGAELALFVLAGDDSGAVYPELAAEHRFLITYAQLFCAIALCDDDLHVQSVPLWEKVIEAIDRPGDGGEADDHLLVGVGVLPGSVDQLRRLALGHWMRRWWPASHRDGIAALDAALIDAEIALLTAAAQDYFADDTLDSDVSDLLAPHSAALNAFVREGDPRVVELVRAAGELTDDVGIVLAEPATVVPRRDDYALAAGADRRQRGAGAIATGTSSLDWSGVPPAVFDAADNTIDWLIEATGSAVNATVGVELSGGDSPSGIPVRLRSGALVGAGVLDDRGQTSFPLVDAQRKPVTESTAWNHDWEPTTVTIGADVDESRETRQRVRDFARARLAAPGGDAFLAEIIAAESDY